MTWWQRLFARGELEDQLDAELRDHLAYQTEEYQRQGLDAAEAHRRASADLGGLDGVKELCRDVGGSRRIVELWRDLCFAARSLRRNRWVSLAAISALGLGIGANGTAFMMVNGLLLSDLPVDRPDQIVAINTGTWIMPRPLPGASKPDFEDWRRENRTFSGMALVRMAGFRVGDDEHAPEQVEGAYVSVDGFDVLGVAPVLGRSFAPDDARPGAPPVVLLGHSVWKARYAGDPDVQGRTIRVDGVPTTVIGVMPSGMRFPLRHELWLPVSQLPGPPPARDARGFFWVFGRLAEGVTLDQARADMTAVSAGLARRYPATNTGVSTTLMPWTAQTNFGGMVRPAVVLLLVAVAFVLLIACGIVATLLLAHAVRRADEVAIRLSLGATRGRIMRQLLAEGLLLALAGGGLGVALLLVGIRWFETELSPFVAFPYWAVISVTPRVIWFMVALCLTAPLLFGLPPALHLARTDVLRLMQRAGRTRTGSRDARRAMSILSVSVVSLSFVLLAGTWALVSSRVLQPPRDVGFDPTSLFTARLTMPADTYGSVEERRRFLLRLDDELATLAGVEVASTTTHAPLRGGTPRRLLIDGRSNGPLRAREEDQTVTVLSLGPRYFDTLGAPLIRGRPLAAVGGERRTTAVVNQRFVDRYFARTDPIGARIQLADPDGVDPHTDWLTVVGVIPTVPQRNSTPAAVYVAHEANPSLPARAEILVRTNADLGASVAVLREAVRRLDPDLPLHGITTMELQVDDVAALARVMLRPFIGLASTALLLVALGLYAMTAYEVSRRTHEIGIRRALGAQIPDVWWLLLRRSLTLIGLGLALGLVGGVGVGRVLGSMVSGAASDLTLLVPVALVLLLVTLTACCVPARRATRLPPVEALRHE